jgi:hypothetical protein
MQSIGVKGFGGSRDRTAIVKPAAAVCCPSVLAAPLDAAQAEPLARGFSALADPNRLRPPSMIAASDEIWERRLPSWGSPAAERGSCPACRSRPTGVGRLSGLTGWRFDAYAVRHGQ